jgi:DNA end-binding protein Ku
MVGSAIGCFPHNRLGLSQLGQQTDKPRFVPLVLEHFGTRFGLLFCALRVCVMAPPSLWSGNLRLSLVLIPVRLVPAVSTEEAISFRQIHEPSGTPIRYVKGVHDGDTFTEVSDEEIVKGYEYAKGHHVLIDPKEIDELKLEAKHTIDMVRFVDEDEIDTRYWEKPYYLIPDGDEANEGYFIMQKALADTGKVAIGQLILHGRAHLVGIKALEGGLMLSILRYADELRDPKPYFESINFEPKSEAVGLAKELIEGESGHFEPEKMPDKYAETLRELLQAKVEQRAPQIEVVTEGKAKPEVVNIMAALKQSMEAKGRAKVRDAVRRRMGKSEKKEQARPRASVSRPSPRRTAH